MKLKTHAFLLFSLIALQVSAQITTISDVEARVSQIQNHLNELRKTEKVQTLESSKHCYYNENELKLVTVQEKGKIEKKVAWYFTEKTLLYTETNWTDTEKGTVLYLEKTYHTDQGKLLAWLNSENTFVDSSSEEFRKMDRSLQDYAAKLLNESEE